MIFAFRSKDSLQLRAFVDEFNEPKSLLIALIRGTFYLEKKIDIVDDFYVVRQKTYFDQIFKYGIILNTGFIIFGLLLHYVWMINCGIFGLFFCASMISKMIWFIVIRLRLLLKGHKLKTELISQDLLCEKLFFKYIGGKNEKRIQ